MPTRLRNPLQIATVMTATEILRPAAPPRPRLPPVVHRRPSRATIRSRRFQSAAAKMTTANCRLAPAAARKCRVKSGSLNHRNTNGARGGGVFGARMSATSTADVENARTAKTGNRICG